MQLDEATGKPGFLAAGSPAARILLALALAAASLAAPSAGRADTATWTSSNLDAWIYTFGGGTRSTMPTFTGGIELDGTTSQYVPKTNTDPARLGMALFAFNTVGHFTPPPTPQHIKINSVTFTAHTELGLGQGELRYTTDPVSHADIYQEMLAEQFSAQRPMELYGLGFRSSSGYTGFAFNTPVENPPVPPLFEENTPNKPVSGYITYPIAASQSHCCGYEDVTNSLTGGFSATAPGNVTGSFDPEPWAIGVADGLSTGDVIPDGTKFSFSLDLTSVAVRQYVQRSLMTGAVAFYLSSWHFTGQEGAGGGYPTWYSKEFPTATERPTLAIDYEIVTPLDGDFDGDRDVDGADFMLWQCTLGTQVTPGLGADADLSGGVDAGDLAEWTANFGAVAVVPSSAAVPEPSADAVTLVFAALGRRRFSRGRVVVRFPRAV